MHCVFWIVAIFLRIGLLEGSQNARLIEELDIEQEIINMKNEINGLKAENKILRNQIGMYHFLKLLMSNYTFSGL